MLNISDKNNLPPISSAKPPKVDFDFLSYEPDWVKMEKLALKYNFLENIILIGQGGSVNAFRGIYDALRHKGSPNLVIVDTNEPNFLKSVLETTDAAKTRF